MYKPAQQVFTTRDRQRIVEEPIIAIVSSEVFIPLVAEYRRSYFPWSLRGGGWGKAQPRSSNLGPSNHLEGWLEPRLRQEGRHGIKEERRYGAQSAF
jgi:hypothetical protein